MSNIAERDFVHAESCKSVDMFQAGRAAVSSCRVRRGGPRFVSRITTRFWLREINADPEKTLCFPPPSKNLAATSRTQIPPTPDMTTTTTTNVTLDDLPQELIDAVISFIPKNAHLKECALVGKRWVRPCQERLFEQVTLLSRATERWTIPVMENQPLLFSYIRKLTLREVYPPDWMDPNFERHMSCFGGGGGVGPDADDAKPCRVHTLKLMDCSVDLDREVISRVLGPLRRTVRTVIMGSVSIPPVMDVRPFFCMFSDLRNVDIPGPQFSSSHPLTESRGLRGCITLPPLDGELKLLFLYHGVEGVLSTRFRNFHCGFDR
jgi:hypothetical protein